MPVYLDGTRALCTPWRWPKVRVVIGAPLEVAEDPGPSHERSQQTAQRVRDAIYALEPSTTAIDPVAPSSGST